MLATFPIYTPILFVDRKIEIDRVLKKAKALANETSSPRPSDRVIHFPGFAGFGKTWLLHHLRYLMTEDRDNKIPQAIVLHIRLRQDWMSKHPDKQPYSRVTSALLKDLLRQVYGAQGIKTDLIDSQAARPDELGSWLQNAIHDVKGQQTVVVLVDDLDEVPPDWLRVLEDRLFAPLILEPRVLLVMAGRNLNYNWTTLALKPPSDEQSIRLRPLSEEDTQEQLGRLAQLDPQFQHAPDFADQIHTLTSGVPEGNALIASQIGQPPKMPDEVKTLKQYNTRLLEQTVPKELQWCFYALCISRGFNTEWLEQLLPVAAPEGRTWDYPAYQGLIRKLTATRLVRAYKKDGEYRYWLDEYLRYRLELELQKRDPNLWQQLHCILMHMYRAWAKNPDYALRWKEEADYHAGCLKDSGYDPEKC
jgi:hypothetical protein